MTTLCYTSGEVAADRQMTVDNGIAIPYSKLQTWTDKKGKNHILTGVGALIMVQKMIEWFKGERKEFPHIKDYDDEEHGHLNANMYVFKRNKLGFIEIRDYHVSRTEYLTYENPEYWAMGSGKQAALAAMELNCLAKEAVKIAAKFDSMTGCGVDVLKL